MKDRFKFWCAILVVVVCSAIAGHYATAYPPSESSPVIDPPCPYIYNPLVTALKDYGILGTGASVRGVAFSINEAEACHTMTVTFNVNEAAKKAIHDGTVP